MSRRYRRRELTDAERAERRQVARDRLEHAARELLTTDGWRRWIKVHGSAPSGCRQEGALSAGVDAFSIRAA